MKTSIALLGSFAVGLVLVGAGCSPMNEPSASDSTTETKPAAGSAMEAKPAMTDDSKATGAMMDEKNPSGITLEAEAIGDNKVKLSWRIDDTKVTDEGFMLVRSDKENPIHDQKNYWWRHHFSAREGTWISVPTGKQHFRICALQNAECLEYSNDVEIDVR